MAKKTKSKMTHYTSDTKYDETKGIKHSTDYKFSIGDLVSYHGGLHERYKGAIGTITKQSCKGHRIDYSIQFLDGTVVNCVLERVLEKVESET